MTTTPRLGLTQLVEGQSGAEITVNEALTVLDVFVQGSVKSASTTAQPGSPTEGDTYLLGASPTGIYWAAYPNTIASYYNGAWQFRTRQTGMVFWVQDSAAFYYFNGTSWTSLAVGGGTLAAANNLSDVASVATARTNLGLGTLATQSGTFSGTSSGTNTGDQTITLTGAVTGTGTGTFATALLAEASTDVGTVLRSPCQASTSQQISSGVIHWCYVGYRPAGEIIKRVRTALVTAGSGSQVAEVGVATCSTAPQNGASLTLTKLWASGTLDDLTTGAPKIVGNSSDNSTPLASAAHVYVGIRVTMGTTQPTFRILQFDWGCGYLLQTVTATAMTSSSSWTAVPVTIGNNSSTDVRGYL